MSCPVCGEICRCTDTHSYTSGTTTLADLDPIDDSEEQFASSIAGSHHDVPDDEQDLTSGSAKPERYASVQPEAAIPAASSPTQQDPDAWRDELNSRLQNYKARRRSSMSDQSLSFNFESTIGNHVFLRPEHEPEPEPMLESSPAPYLHSATAPALEPPPEFLSGSFPSESSPSQPMDQTTQEAQQSFGGFAELDLKPILPETAKLILFPRPPMMVEPSHNELAEPVFDRPRILDAPEAIDTVAVPLSDITLQPAIPEDQCVPNADPEFELPFQVAPMTQRVSAELLDTLLVLVGSALFGVIVAQLNSSLLLQDPRSLASSFFFVTALLWSLYKYIFLVYGGSTLGMKLARLRLVDFTGSRPKRLRRQFRALAMLVSIFPLGLGLLWSFVDDDTLCWHDRISRTYMTAL